MQVTYQYLQLTLACRTIQYNMCTSRNAMDVSKGDVAIDDATWRIVSEQAPA